MYIGNISPEVEHEELRAIIASYGPLVSMRMYRKEGYGFAEFENHHDAVRAILGARSRLLLFTSSYALCRLVQYSACTAAMHGPRRSTAEHAASAHTPVRRACLAIRNFIPARAPLRCVQYLRLGAAIACVTFGVLPSNFSLDLPTSDHNLVRCPDVQSVAMA